jgi:transcriptional regulator with XRE-family HTH domain
MKVAQYSNLGNLISTGRRRVGLEQAELGRLLGTSQQSVSRWEAGFSRPRRGQLSSLARVIGESEAKLQAAANFVVALEALPERTTVSHDQPFPVDALAPDSFERLVEDIVRSLYPEAREVRSAGKTGHDQSGIDALAVFPDGRRYSFQCKRVTRFGPADVRNVVSADKQCADRKYLVLSRVASPQTAEEVRKFPEWILWDKNDIARLIRNELSPIDRRVLVDKYFPGQRYALLGQPNPGPWQTPDEFFAPFSSGVYSAFSHDWQLVGQAGEVGSIVDILSNKSHGMVLLLGAGGTGKSRVLKEVTSRLKQSNGSAPLFLSPTEALGAQSLELLGNGPVTVIVDDAHDRTDLPALISFAANPERDIRILFASRPYARERLRGQVGQYARGGMIEEVELSRLSLAAATKLAKEVLARFGGEIEFAGPIARATRDCPLVTVVAGRIAAQENLPLALVQNSQGFRDTILGKFAKILTGELAPPGEQRIFTEILKLISLVQPFSIEDAAFRELAVAVTGVTSDTVSTTLRTLIEGGILFRRGAQYRLMPDLLGDYIIEQTCIGVDERLDSFADRVFASAAPPLLGHVLVNLGRLDWRRNSGDPAKSHLLAHLWRGLKVTGSYHDSALEAAAAAAFYQPRQALDFVTRQWREGVRQDGLVKIIRHAAYNVGHLVDACGLLWEMGRNDNRELGRFPNHALRTLKELCDVEPEKPIAINEKIVDFGLMLLGQPDAFETIFSPFDFLKGILSGEGHTTVSDSRAITFEPFTVNYSAVRRLRECVVDRAIALLSGSSLRAAGRAASFLEDALRYPMPIFGMDIANELMAQYTEEFRKTLARLRDLVQSEATDPVVSIAIAHTVSWHANYAGGETAAIAREVIDALPKSLEFRLLAALSDGFGRVFLGRIDAATWQSRLNDWMAAVLEDVSMAYPKAIALRSVMEHALMRVAEVGVAKSNSSPFLIREMLRVRPDLARLIVEEAANAPNSRLCLYLDAALFQMLHRDSDEGRRWARRLLDSGNVAFQRAVGLAYSNPPLEADMPASADVEIIKRVLSSSNPQVVRSGLGILSVPLKGSRLAFDLLRHTNLKLDVDITDEAFMMFYGRDEDVLSGLDEDDVRYLLAELKSLPELRGHWIETLISRLSLQFPELTTEFFLARADLAAASDEAFSKMRPINYGAWVHIRPRFKESNRYATVLEAVWQWMTAQDSSDWRFEHNASALFEGMFLPIDEAVLSFLSTKIATAEKHSLRWTASVLAHADHNFVFDHHALVVNFLEACGRSGEPIRRRAIDALFRSAISGIHRGSPGEPFPRDVKCLEASLAVLSRLPRLSAAYELYDQLREHSEGGIARARREAEFFDDG